MKLTIPCCVALSLGLAGTAFAACEMPAAVPVPDGATATEQELLRVQDEVKAYIAAMDRYIACTNEEIRARGQSATDEYLFQMSTRIASARSEVDSVATQFNEQVVAFREARDAGALPLRQP